MRVVTPTDMRKRLGEILDAASAGERILIERDHKPLAVLVSVEEAELLDERTRKEQIERRIAALDRLIEFGREMREKYPPAEGDMSAAEWIRWDRDHRDDRHRHRAGENDTPLDEGDATADSKAADEEATR